MVACICLTPLPQLPPVPPRIVVGRPTRSEQNVCGPCSVTGHWSHDVPHVLTLPEFWKFLRMEMVRFPWGAADAAGSLR